MKFRLCFFLLLIAIPCYLFSQKSSVKFGKIDIADLEMKTYSPDTEAIAVVLYDYGYVDASTISFTRIHRIKVLKKEGLDEANFTIEARSGTQIKGFTYNLENGEIITTKLKSESIFKEKVTDDIYYYHVAMPNVKVGSVFEIKFTMSWFPSEWRFQNYIPTFYSELEINTSPNISLRQNFYGHESLSTVEPNRWVARQMPGIKKESFVNTYSNYITKFEFEINYIHLPEQKPIDIATSWESVNKFLLNTTYFGKVLSMDGSLMTLSWKIKNESTTDLEKLTKAYALAKTLNWNGKSELYSSMKNLSFVFQDKKGNSADINLSLLLLLRNLDIDAEPVALSTRENGILSSAYPALNKLNYVIVRAKVDNVEYLLDATDPMMPLGMLPKQCLNGKGRLIKKENSDWVQLETGKQEMLKTEYELSVVEDLTFKGKLVKTYSDYAALDKRKLYQKYNTNDDYTNELEKTNSGLKIENYAIANMHSLEKPIEESYDLKFENYIEEIGESVYIYPMLNEITLENPFKESIRRYPIDMDIAINRTYVAKIKIPEGYTVTNTPESINIALPNNMGKFIYSISTLESSIQIMCILTIGQDSFLADEYTFVQDFYNKIIKKQAEPIVMKKK